MVIPAGYGQINWIYGGAAQPNGAQTTCGVDVSGLLTDPEDALVLLASGWSTGWGSVVNGSTSLVGLRLKFGPDETGPFYELSTNLPGAGAGAGMTPAVAVLVKKITALGGRKGRGRMFIPSPDEDAAGGNGVLSPTPLLDWQDAADDVYNSLVGMDLPPVVLHTDSTTPTPITSFQVAGTVATQRRRQRR